MPQRPTGTTGSAYGHLKLRHLQLLALLERERSITRAAEQIHLSQPAVSAMVRELESIFGMTMIERSARGVTLTRGAQAALRRFSIALAEVDSARHEASLAEAHERQRLRVGALSVALVDLVPRALQVFFQTAAPAQVQMIEGTVDGLSGQLMNGELDCVVGRLGPAWAKSAAAAQQVLQVPLVDEPRCIVCRAGHPLARRGVAGLSVLAEQGWILQPPPSSTRLLFDELFLDRGMAPPVPVVESASVHSNIAMVAATDLLAVVPLPVAQRMIAKGELQRLPARVELTRMSLSIVWRRTADADPLVSRFRDAVVAASRRPDRRGSRTRGR